MNCDKIRKYKPMNKILRKYNYIEEYINSKRSVGAYAFSYNEVLGAFDVTAAALNMALLRLKKRHLIAQVRKGFYVILPPEFSSKGMLPATLFIDDLMKALNKDYYVALFSAAFFHGVAHQSPMEFFVVTSGEPLRPIKTPNLKINFFLKKKWDNQSVVLKKTDAGYINVSSPELTALDLFFYSAVVSLNRAYTILQELNTLLKPSPLYKAAIEYPVASCIQRLGYLLDVHFNSHKLADVLFKALNERKFDYLPLSCHNLRKGKRNAKWKIIINTEMEGDI